MNDGSLETIIMKRILKNFGELHRQWIEAGVSTSRATMHRCLEERKCSCHIPNILPIPPIERLLSKQPGLQLHPSSATSSLL